MRKSILIVLLALILAFALSNNIEAQENIQHQNSCEGNKIIKSIVDGNLNQALEYSNNCIKYNKEVTANIKVNNKLEEGWNIVYVLCVGYYLCSSAQINAMLGNITESKELLSEAELFASNWPSVYLSSLFEWSDVYESTKGFILEKSGDLHSAKEYYAAHKSDNSLSRLALIFMTEHKYDEAIAYAKGAGDEPTAYYVLASIEEKKGNVARAKELYTKAQQMIIQQSKGNPSQPIFAIEYSKIKSAVEHLR